MKRYILFCLLLINSTFISAKPTLWYEGSLVLKTKEVLVGEISIESEYNLILHRNNGKVDVYPAHKIQAVYFYDEESNINRKFVSLKEAGLFNHYQLLEIVLRGEVSVYRKQKTWTGNSPSDADGYHYFIFQHDQLIGLLKFRNQVYPLLIDEIGNMLTTFIDENKLNPNSSADAIMIIGFYNSLKKEDQLLAKH
ncbi:MAG: hypothetical protein ABI663_23370 [Chryseolinea sp.]